LEGWLVTGGINQAYSMPLLIGIEWKDIKLIPFVPAERHVEVTGIAKLLTGLAEGIPVR
jgi:hypothetical protein